MKKYGIILASLLIIGGVALADDSTSLQEAFPGNVVFTGGVNSSGYGQLELGYNWSLPAVDITPSVTYFSKGFGVSVMGLYAVPETLYLVSVGGYASDFQGAMNVGPVIQINPLSNFSFQAGYLFGANPGAMFSFGYNFI